jgi:hypothetical protein
MTKLLIKFIAYIIRKKKFSLENKTKIMNALIENLKIVPINAIIRLDEQNQLVVNGVTIGYEEAKVLRESAKLLLHSNARKLIHNQLIFEAINLGIHQGVNTEQILFSKAVIWLLKEQEKLIGKIAQEETAP